MSTPLPPIRLVGAVILRDGVLSRRSIALAGGRFTTGPLPAVDLSGYHVLPGIVDLHHTGFQRHLGATDARPGGGLSLADREAASHGVTTRILSLPWSWERPGLSPDAAERVAADWAARRPALLTDLRLQICCETHMVSEADRLSALVRSGRIAQVLFVNRAGIAAERQKDGVMAFAHWAWQRGATPETLVAALGQVLGQSAAVPRHLCRMAELFDDHGVVYGSLGDATAETREHYSMLGARLCMQPGSMRVAAAARAVGDPVAIAADDIIHPAPGRSGPRLSDPVRRRMGDALVSDLHSSAPVEAAFRLVDLGLTDLAGAWRLVSTRPAEIMRLPDRGVIAPGKRADFTVVNIATRTVEATVAAGRVSYLSGDAAARFVGAAPQVRHAAE